MNAASVLKTFMMIIVPLLMLAASSTAYSATYVVSPSGTGIAAGTVQFPLNSINAAVAKATAGDTVLVRTGTYKEAVTVWRSGTAAAPIKIQAYPRESPVINGENKLPSDEYNGLLNVSGSYIEFAGFEVKNSAGMCIRLDGAHNTATKINAHHCKSNGILGGGDYSIIQDSKIWQSSLVNLNGVNGSTGAWGAGLSVARDWYGDKITQGAIVRRNVVYDNWGEGLSSFEADGALIEDNVVYDNFAVNLYISDTANALVQRNLVYATARSVTLFGRPARGIGMSNETSNKPLNNITIVNNLVMGTSAPFVYFVNTGPNTLSNTLIAYNTFANGTSGHAGSGITAVFSGGSYTNVRFINNVVMQEDSSSVVFVAQDQTGLTFSSNLWSKAPQSAASAQNDIVGDPLLTKTGLTAAQTAVGSGVGQSAGEAGAGMVTAEAFRPKAGSPALSKGIPLPEVTTDYYKTPRGQKPTIGAIGSPEP